MERIATSFALSNPLTLTEYRGPVVVGPNAVYLVICGGQSGRGPGATAGAVTGGLIGGLVGAAVDYAVNGDQSARSRYPFETVEFRTLKVELEDMWIWGDVKRSDPMIVLPKKLVTTLKFSYFSGITVSTENDSFRIKVGPFAVSKAKQVFAEYNWKERVGPPPKKRTGPKRNPGSWIRYLAILLILILAGITVAVWIQAVTPKSMSPEMSQPINLPQR